MSRIGFRSYRINSLSVALAFFLSAQSMATDLGPLPFDHRRLLLVQMDKTEIPKTPVLSQILDEMRIRGRYQWVLASKPGDALLPVVVPRDFSWDSPPSVKKMAEKYGVDGLLWIQEREQEVLLKWYDGKEGLPLVFDSTFLRTDADVTTRVRAWMDSIWGKFPGVGFVAKRDAKFLYFEGVSENQLKVGDELVVLRVEAVSRHKLFKTLADFRASPIGKAKVVSLEKVLAKAEVLEESSLDPVRMGDRYQVQLVPEQGALPLAVEVGSQAKDATLVQPSFKNVSAERQTSNSLGTVGFLGAYGTTLHAENTEDDVNPELKRNAPALELNAMGHITSQWLGWFDYRYRFSTFVKPGALFNSESFLNTRLSSLSFLFGYRFFLGDLMNDVGAVESPDFWLAPFVGYRYYAFTASDQTLNYGPTSKKWNSLALGFHLRFPFSDKWHARITASKSLFISFSEKDELSGGSPSPSAAEFAGSLFLNVSASSAVGCGFRYQSMGARYDGAGTRGVSATSVNLKVSELTANYETSF